MQIVFIHRSKAFLPELHAYTRYFNQHGIKTNVITSSKNDIKADVEWYFMGIYPKRSSVVTIHEYASASVPPFALLKDVLKRKVNAAPDFRIFNNEYVQQQLAFRDQIPGGIRDFGIDPTEHTPVASTKKEYDFIYTGSTATHRKMDRLLHCFTKGALRGHSLLILSREYDQLAKKMSSFRNIHFAGPVPQTEVRNYLRKASFGINYIVDEAPFNQQTSAKLVEYAAAGLPVITNSYDWVNTFEQKSGGVFFKIDKEFSNLTWEQVNRFDYKAPDLSGWSWEDQINKSGVMGFLKSAFPGRMPR
jgi:glycosyltransferase involved in cell wall biosynthesis